MAPIRQADDTQAGVAITPGRAETCIPKPFDSGAPEGRTATFTIAVLCNNPFRNL